MQNDNATPSAAALDPAADPGAERVGLIAGAGRLPVEAANQLRSNGRSVVAIGFPGLTTLDLEHDVVDAMHWLELGQLEALATTFERCGVSRILIVGKIPKSVLFAGQTVLSPDAEAKALLAARADRSDEGLTALVSGWLESRGFSLLDQGVELGALLAPVGTLTTTPVDEAARADLVAGWPIVEALGRAGVGQCVVMKDGAVLAVEAIEGTDETIRRAGRLGGPGSTVIKAIRPGQDRRLDLPAIGPETIRVMVEAGAGALAVEAGSALILERARCLADAERAGIVIWGFDANLLRTSGVEGFSSIRDRAGRT